MKYYLFIIVIVILVSFTFNMTKQLEDETKLLDICIHTDIKIPNCNMITGKINSSYGEAIK